MNKFIVTVLGQDRPGILAAVSNILLQEDCNIENISQMILQSEFTGNFIVASPSGLTLENLTQQLNQKLKDLELYVYVKPIKQDKTCVKFEGEPFIITTRGPDKKGLVASITAIIAEYGVNITNLKAIFKGGDNPDNNIMFYEVSIPNSIDQQAMHQKLRQQAQELGLEINIQHKNIFNATNKI